MKKLSSLILTFILSIGSVSVVAADELVNFRKIIALGCDILGECFVTLEPGASVSSELGLLIQPQELYSKVGDDLNVKGGVSW